MHLLKSFEFIRCFYKTDVKMYDMVKQDRTYIRIVLGPMFIFISFVMGNMIFDNIFLATLLILSGAYMLLVFGLATKTLRQYMQIEKEAYVEHASAKEAEMLQRERHMKIKEQTYRESMDRLYKEREAFEREKRFYENMKNMDDQFRGYRQQSQPNRPPHIVNFYSILGVPFGGNMDAVKKAYRQLAKKYHPDTGGDADLFKVIKNAYEELSKYLKTS